VAGFTHVLYLTVFSLLSSQHIVVKCEWHGFEDLLDSVILVSASHM